MSYILGALKRAEKERAGDKPVSLNEWNRDDWDQLESEKGGSKLLLWLVSFTLISVLIIFAVLAYKIMSAAPEQVASTESEWQTGSADRFGTDRREIDSGGQNAGSKPEIDAVQLNQAEVVPVFVDLTKAVDVPSEIQSRPEFPEFSGHMYFPNSAQLSRVFSGASSYRQGETIEGYLIAEIEEAEVVLSFEGVDYRVELDR